MFTLVSFTFSIFLLATSFYFHNKLNFSKHVYYEIVNEKRYEKMFEDSSIEDMLKDGCVIEHTEFGVPFFYTLHRIFLLLGIVSLVASYSSMIYNCIVV